MTELILHRHREFDSRYTRARYIPRIEIIIRDIFDYAPRLREKLSLQRACIAFPAHERQYIYLRRNKNSREIGYSLSLSLSLVLVYMSFTTVSNHDLRVSFCSRTSKEKREYRQGRCGWYVRGRDVGSMCVLLLPINNDVFMVRRRTNRSMIGFIRRERERERLVEVHRNICEIFMRARVWLLLRITSV